MDEPWNQTTEQVWAEFWYPIFAEADRKGREEYPYYDPEHQIVSNVVFEQMKKELFDYRCMMRNVNLLLWHITHGRVSKPNTSYEAVMGVLEDLSQEQWKEAQQEIVEFLYEKDQEGHFAAFTAGDLADLIAVHFGITGNPNFDKTKKVNTDGA